MNIKDFESCPKCSSYKIEFVGYNGDGVYLLGAAMNCQNCGFQYETEDPGKILTEGDILGLRTHDFIERLSQGFDDGFEEFLVVVYKNEVGNLVDYINYLERK